MLEIVRLNNVIFTYQITNSVRDQHQLYYLIE